MKQNKYHRTSSLPEANNLAIQSNFRLIKVQEAQLYEHKQMFQEIATLQAQHIKVNDELREIVDMLIRNYKRLSSETDGLYKKHQAMHKEWEELKNQFVR